MIFKSITFEHILYEWLDNKKQFIKESSYNKYLFCIENYLISNRGSIDFKKLKSSDIEQLFNLNNICNLSNSTKNIILIIINSSIKYGMEKKYRKNLIEMDIKFKKKKNEITYFTIKEQEILENYVNHNMNIRNLAILVSLYTGLRLGELCALKGTDIDFINNTIYINKTVQRIKNNDGNSKTKLVIDIPKTTNSTRVIPVPVFIINLLKQYIEDKDNYIFTGTNKPKDPRTLEKYFTSLLKRLNLKPLNWHSLRHSFSTRLREQKVDIKVISELLGHSNWKTTQEIYVHASLDSKIQSMNELSSLISKGS